MPDLERLRKQLAPLELPHSEWMETREIKGILVELGEGAVYLGNCGGFVVGIPLDAIKTGRIIDSDTGLIAIRVSNNANVVLKKSVDAELANELLTGKVFLQGRENNMLGWCDCSSYCDCGPTWCDCSDCLCGAADTPSQKQSGKFRRPL